MLVKFLSMTDKAHLLELAQLLFLADNPLLWDGKRKEDINSQTDLSKLSILKNGRESALIADLESEGEQTTTLGAFFSANSIEEKLIKKLKALPLQAVDEPTSRAEAATAILKELLEGKEFDLPSVPKLMLFELMSMALCDGSISNIEWVLLETFQHHHHLDEIIFNELLERAETTNREVNKTISIILE